MKRRDFIKSNTIIGGAYLVATNTALGEFIETPPELAAEPWFNRSMRWAQIAFVDNDPANYDPQFWLDYLKRIHADGVLLSAGGVTAFYPTDIPLHHRSEFLGKADPLGDMIAGARKINPNMTVILRTDPHACRQDVYDAHPDWIAVEANGQKRRHWANKDLWVTCCLGPYNFEFMTAVHKEIMTKYKPEGIFSNRWSGSGMCYCEHCQKNFKDFTGGKELPRAEPRGAGDAGAAFFTNRGPVSSDYTRWRSARLRELWKVWDDEVRKIQPTSRWIPNGFPDRIITGKNSDFFFVDHQGRTGLTPPWDNGRSAKELRTTMGLKPQVGIFSVGSTESNRWKDSVQSGAELKIWMSDGVANGLLPCFVKFNATPYDKRWMKPIEESYQLYHRSEKYLRNTASLARVGLLYAEGGGGGGGAGGADYGKKPWQQQSNVGDHTKGMYHGLIEGRIPFEMIHDDLMDEQTLAPFKLLILANAARLSDAQCDQIRKFVQRGGSLLATFESSLYDENGKQRADFGLADVLGVSYDQGVEGPMQNSYLRLKSDAATGKFHPILEGLEDANRIINGVYRVKVTPKTDFPSPVTLVPTYPDLPMEDVYVRQPDTTIREVYLRQVGNGRVAYVTWDIDRVFWQMLVDDHSKLLRNVVKWTLNEDPVVTVQGQGIVQATAWRQANSMAVHLVNFTNPMMMKGPFRELIPITAQKVSVKIPAGATVKGVNLMASQTKPKYETVNGRIVLEVPSILDHEIIGIDLA